MATTYATYSDCGDYVSNATANVETASLVGMNTTLSGTGCVQGATTLAVGSTASAPASPTTFQAYVLDGLNSETCIASVQDATHLSVPAGTLAAHAGGVSVSSAGTNGCLADVIVTASRLLESICRQGYDGSLDRSLFAVSRTERLSGPSSARAAVDRDGSLLLTPYHFPVQSVTSVTMQMGAQSAQTVSLTYNVQPDGARRIWIPSPVVIGTAPTASTVMGAWWPRNYGFVATVVYTGGPISAGTGMTAIPDDIRKACHFLISDILGYRRNPTGAAEVRLGDSSLSARLRGDTSGNSILMIQARNLLLPYTALPM